MVKSIVLLLWDLGKRQNPYTGRNINLDETYEKVIQPLFMRNFRILN